MGISDGPPRTGAGRRRARLSVLLRGTDASWWLARVRVQPGETFFSWVNVLTVRGEEIPRRKRGCLGGQHLPDDMIRTQTLDHFNFQVQQYFGQNYYVNDQYWNGTGPIFCTLFPLFASC